MQKSDFSYEKCRAGFCYGDGYMSSRSDGGTISLRTYECEERLSREQNPLGWKFHISIDDEKENMIRAWENLVPIFINHRVNFIKFIRPDAHQDDRHSVSERGRQFTIYIEQNPEKNQDDWQMLINEITDKLVGENIRPGYQNVVAKAVPGSSYFYYRNDLPPPPEDNPVTKRSPQLMAKETIRASHVEGSPPLSPKESIGVSQLEGSPPLLPKESMGTSHIEESPPLIAKETVETSHNESTQTSDRTKKVVVPTLRLQGFVPSWTKRPVAEAKDIYLDDRIEKKYNPSDADERILPKLKVEINNQLEPKRSSENDLLTPSK